MDVKTGLMMFRMMPIQRGMMIVIMRNTKILIDLLILTKMIRKRVTSVSVGSRSE